VRGEIIDKKHPDVGASLANHIMVMSSAKGSSSSSSVLAEAVRNGTGPSGIIMLESDLIIAIGAITASELYGIDMPILSLSEADFVQLRKICGTISIEVSADLKTALVSVPS
jgi:predicted aconitase with swiveling domain